jgi:hypothetical protein
MGSIYGVTHARRSSVGSVHSTRWSIDDMISLAFDHLEVVTRRHDRCSYVETDTAKFFSFDGETDTTIEFVMGKQGAVPVRRRLPIEAATSPSSAAVAVPEIPRGSNL